MCRSSQGSPDWTCIVAGFTSGYMRIYLQVHSYYFDYFVNVRIAFTIIPSTGDLISFALEWIAAPFSVSA